MTRWMMRVTLVLALTLGVVGAHSVSAPRQTEAATSAACLNTQETIFLAKINAYRQAYGLKPLVATRALDVSSYQHSADMGLHKYFAHNSLDGTTPWQRMANAGYAYNTTKGENIAAGYGVADAVFNAWKDSPDHNANMLNPNFKAIGIGFVQVNGSPYTYYWTTDFGGVVDAQPSCS